MLITTYRRAQFIRLAAMLIVVIAIGFTASKLYFSYQKISDYSQAKKRLEASDSISAEEFFRKTANNSYIQYRETETATALEELKPVTEIKTRLQEIIDTSNRSVKKGDLQALLASLGQYRASKREADAKETSYAALYTKVSYKLGMEKLFEDSFDEMKDQLSDDLRSQIKKKTFSDEAAASLLSIPSAYIGSDQERLSFLRTHLEPFDQARIDSMAAKKPFEDVIQEGERLRSFYREHHVESDWLVTKIEQFAIQHLKKNLEKKDISAFAKDAKTYEKHPELAAKKSAVAAFIRTEYAKQLEIAKQLSQSKKFDQAIQAYQKLNAYRDATKAIQQIELEWASEEPAHILQKVVPNQKFSNVINGRDHFGAIIYAVGVTNGNLVLARMLPDMSMDKKEINLDSSITIKEIHTVDDISMKENSALLVEGRSSSRNSRYIGFEVQSSGLKKILDVEADSYRIEKPGLLVVKNAAGKGAGQESFYTYRNGGYAFDGIKPDYVEISLKDLRKYKNTKVRFKCTILAADGNTAVVEYNGAYILLHGKSKMRTGGATITGTWVSNDTVKKGAQSIPAYNVNVFSLVQ